MSNVLSLELARERAWRPRGGSNGHAFKKAKSVGVEFPNKGI